MEALQRLLLYAEMSREKYKACLPDIQRSNRQRVTAYLGIACAFLTVLWILSGVLEFLRPNMLAYMIALAVCILFSCLILIAGGQPDIPGKKRPAADLADVRL